MEVQYEQGPCCFDGQNHKEIVRFPSMELRPASLTEDVLTLGVVDAEQRVVAEYIIIIITVFVVEVNIIVAGWHCCLILKAPGINLFESFEGR